jgi:hypothetical protein
MLKTKDIKLFLIKIQTFWSFIRHTNPKEPLSRRVKHLWRFCLDEAMDEWSGKRFVWSNSKPSLKLTWKMTRDQIPWQSLNTGHTIWNGHWYYDTYTISQWLSVRNPYSHAAPSIVDTIMSKFYSWNYLSPLLRADAITCNGSFKHFTT